MGKSAKENTKEAKQDYQRIDDAQGKAEAHRPQQTRVDWKETDVGRDPATSKNREKSYSLRATHCICLLMVNPNKTKKYTSKIGQ